MVSQGLKDLENVACFICVDFLEGQFPLSINVNNQATILMANSIIHLVPRSNLTWPWKLTSSKLASWLARLEPGSGVQRPEGIDAG